MKKRLVAIAVAFAALGVTASQAATTVVTGGTGLRSAQIAAFGPIGQSFTAIDSELTSFGFQIQTLNPGSAVGPITLTLRAGSGLGGAVLATRALTPVGVPAGRVPTWIDFDFTGTMLDIGQSYTALLSTTSSRFAMVFGPDINIFTGQPLGGDAYAGGEAISNRALAAPCTAGGICDANFRFSGVTAAAVPEPASWAMLIAGFGLVGGTLRRRRDSIAAVTA